MSPVAGRLAGRLIGLGVSGSIAAYKSVELLRLLRAEGADVVVLLTPSATRFVSPLTLEALSGHPVETDVLALQADGRIGHIVVADTADAIVVAPATAHWLGAMANGLASDTVTATCLATSAPVIVAPAMDGEMWDHPATQRNVRRLRDGYGYGIVEPEAGPLASGQVGIGRLADLHRVVEAVVAAVGTSRIRNPDPATRPPLLEHPPREADLEGRHLVVSAGGTREPIDPVRFIGNRSSGRMGVAIAEAALDRGAEVTLVAANLEVPTPPGAEVVPAETTSAMRAAVLRAVLGGAGEDAQPPADVLVMAAAVADFRPAERADRKLSRDEGRALAIEPTEDILAEVGRLATTTEPRPVLVGFAAETGSLDRAAGKLAAKGVDLLVANDVSEPDAGFAVDTNRVVVLDREGGSEAWPLLTKREVADRLLDRVARLLDARDAERHTALMPSETRP
jgi:phosphopantothenoylcysteine decarboxylase/phosphopantothenate--cysteine ligase